MREVKAAWTAVAVAAAVTLVAGPAHADTPSHFARTSDTNSLNKAQPGGCDSPDEYPLAVSAEVKDGGAQVGRTNLILSPFGEVTVVATEDDTGFSGGWQVTTSSACHLPPVDWEVVASSSAQRSATATCRPGMKVYTAGGGVSGGLGNVMLERLRIAPDLGSVTVAGSEDDDGFAGPWAVTAQAICGTPHAGQTRRSATTAVDSAATKTVVASCQGAGRVHGVGGEITGGGGQVRIVAVKEDDKVSGVRITATEDEDGYAGVWSATAYAVCAP
ncbi:hypothetical protein [Dactylosporangium maewongense]|uniref:hypothetical protein n=1 Tax=Dactylosporangium maewongense TaxID=634393 RepID=UPI0031DF8F89